MPEKSLYQRALDAITDRIGDLIALLIDGGGGAIVAWIVFAAVVVAAGILLARGLQRDRRRRHPDALDLVTNEARRPPADWAAEAARFEAEGAWRDALRCRYRWLIASLAGAGVVDEVPGTTAGEYRAMVGAARPATAEPIAGATDLFERAWYGDEPTGPKEMSDFHELAGRVLSGAQR